MRAGFRILLWFAAGGLLAAASGCGPEFMPATTGTGGGGGTGGTSGPGGAGGTGGTGGDGGTGGAMCSATGPVEICGDGIDNDCDGQIDPANPCKGLGTFVSEAGDDANPGTTSAPVRTITKGIANAIQIAVPSTTVHVAAGLYEEDVALAPDVLVLGGHDPETWERDPGAYPIVIGCTSFACVRAGTAVGRSALLDGFEIQGLDGTPAAAPGGVAVQISGGSPTISNNQITGGIVDGVSRRSIAVHVLGAPAPGPLLEGNRIEGGSSATDAAVGVLLDAGTRAVITGNEIAGGAGQSSFGILEEGALAGTEITGNTIRGGSAVSTTAPSFGVRCRGEVQIGRNHINADLSNPAQCASLSMSCGGIHSDSSSARIENNVVFGADARLSVAIYLTEISAAAPEMHVNSNYLDGLGSGSTLSTARSSAIALVSPYAGASADAQFAFIRNNILLGGRNQNRYGIYEETVISGAQTCSPKAFTHNLFHFADLMTGSNVLYRNWDGAQATTITALGGLDPAYVENKAGNPMVDMMFHLMEGSPCKGAGTEQDAPVVDIDGEVRPQDVYDIGPDEVP